MKPKRIVDNKLLKAVRALPCLACASIHRISCSDVASGEFTFKSDAHHVITRAAGGDDVPGNVISLCRLHHQEIHRIGKLAMAEKYEVVFGWFETESVKEYLNGR